MFPLQRDGTGQRDQLRQALPPRTCDHTLTAGPVTHHCRRTPGHFDTHTDGHLTWMNPTL